MQTAAKIRVAGHGHWTMATGTGQWPLATGALDNGHWPPAFDNGHRYWKMATSNRTMATDTGLWPWTVSHADAEEFVSLSVGLEKTKQKRT